MSNVRAIVMDENTLGYLRGDSKFMGVLHGSVLKGSLHCGPLAAPVFLDEFRNVRDATLEDFAEYNVSPVGFLVPYVRKVSTE